MNWRFIPLALVSAIAYTLSGCQEKEKDFTTSDSVRLSQMAEDSILHAKPVIARQLLKEAQECAKDSDEYYFAEAVRSSLALNCIGLDSALYHINSVENFCNRQSDINTLRHTILTLSGHNRGLILMYTQQPDSAISNYKRIINHSINGLYKKWIPAIYCKIGDLYGTKNDFPLQAYYYRRGLFVADSLGLSETDKFNCYGALGFSYTAVKDFDQAGEYLNKAYLQINNVYIQEQFAILNNLINYHYYQKQYDKAWKYMMEVYNIIEPYKVSMPYENALVKTNYADLAIQSGKNMEHAGAYLEEAMSQFNKLGMTSPSHYLNSLQLSLALKSNDMNRAHKLIDGFSNDTTKNIVEINYQIFRNTALIDYYKKKGNSEKALSIMEMNDHLEDSLRSDRQKKYVADLNLRYQNDITHLRNSITIKEQSNKITVLILGIISGLIFFSSITLYFIGYLRRAKREKRREYENHIHEISKLKMQNIREKISPHFIFNVLNREINTHTQSESEYNRLMQLTKLLRKALTLSNQTTISLTEELDLVTTYINLLQDIGSRFKFRFHKDDDVDAESIQVPSMIIQIPVENAIKHGFAGMENGGIIDISINNLTVGTEITIWNNGNKYEPFKPSDNTNSTGTGMKVIYQTLMLMNAHNKEHITFNICENNNGTEVKIYIPFGYAFNW